MGGFEKLPSSERISISSIMTSGVMMLAERNCAPPVKNDGVTDSA
jgi:hypothetical protein